MRLKIYAVLTRSQQPPLFITRKQNKSMHTSILSYFTIMTTRRNISDDRGELGRDGKSNFKPVPGEKSNIAPAVPA
jgi:hypothetical protein